MVWAFIRAWVVVAVKVWHRKQNSERFAFETLLTSSGPVDRKEGLLLSRPSVKTSWLDGLFEEVDGPSTCPHALPSAQRTMCRFESCVMELTEIGQHPAHSCCSEMLDGGYYSLDEEGFPHPPPSFNLKSLSLKTNFSSLGHQIIVHPFLVIFQVLGWEVFGEVMEAVGNSLQTHQPSLLHSLISCWGNNFSNSVMSLLLEMLHHTLCSPGLVQSKDGF